VLESFAWKPLPLVASAVCGYASAARVGWLVSISVILLPISCYHRLATASVRFPRFCLRPQPNVLRFDAGVLRLVADSIDVHIRCVSDFRLTGLRLGFARVPIVAVSLL